MNRKTKGIVLLVLGLAGLGFAGYMYMAVQQMQAMLSRPDVQLQLLLSGGGGRIDMDTPIMLGIGSAIIGLGAFVFGIVQLATAPASPAAN